MKNSKPSSNRKALPKFLFLVLIFSVIGFIIGLISGRMETTDLPTSLALLFNEGIVAIAPYSIWIITAVLSIAELRLYNQAHSLYTGWDGEDEQPISTAETKLSWTLLLANTNLVINFFFFGTIHILIRNHAITEFLFTLAGFIIGIILIMIVQQKVVDLTKKINPEKKGSVYDTRFRQIWMDSCDENEKILIGKASYKAFIVTSNLCIALWVILLMISSIYPIGMLPIFLVTLIWGVLSGVYCLETLRLEKH